MANKEFDRKFRELDIAMLDIRDRIQEMRGYLDLKGQKMPVSLAMAIEEQIHQARNLKELLHDTIDWDAL